MYAGGSRWVRRSVPSPRAVVVLAAAGCLYYPNLGDLSDGGPAGDASTVDGAVDAKPLDGGGDAGRFCLSSNHGNPGGDTGGNPVPNDRWFHVTFDVDPTKSMKATIDDQPFSTTWSAQPGGNPTTRLSLGVSGYNQPAPEYRLNYDNVTVDFP